MASWEIFFCGDVLTQLLSQLSRRPTAWDEDWNGGEAVTQKTIAVIQDIENFRLASPLWRDIIDDSLEWALIRLSRWDYGNEVGPVWEEYNDYIVNRFFLSWETFNTTWTMATSIADPCIRMDPVGWLTKLELSILRSHLWDPSNVRINVAEGATRRHAHDIWVSPHHRC
ncbi:hypothetical protein KC19_VG159900 [Ceratodon purpureus]|uniref:Uncharacterized protein n=1 Tax=Ceratodon purpureus TaxID=3225 RepID=A0A8T0HR05_CERPU|nr:hypothetical protein KC19_VG159900 [Ceratodon purpureus]KAG0573228.1 hypothetical protein KC19_VG159900 [Ceratodon purpureus]